MKYLNLKITADNQMWPCIGDERIDGVISVSMSRDKDGSTVVLQLDQRMVDIEMVLEPPK